MNTGIYAALCGLILIFLYIRVSQRRLATKIGMGAGGDAIYIHAFGIALVLARIGHAQGLSATSGRSTGRFYGSIVTLLVIAGLSVWLFVVSVAKFFA